MAQIIESIDVPQGDVAGDPAAARLGPDLAQTVTRLLNDGAAGAAAAGGRRR